MQSGGGPGPPPPRVGAHSNTPVESVTRSALADLFSILGWTEQALELTLIGDPDLDHPALSVRIAIDERGISVERLIDSYDLAGGRAVEITDCLHRLDRAKDSVLVEGVPHIWEFDEDDVTQLTLGIIGDAHKVDTFVTRWLQVLVFLRI